MTKKLTIAFFLLWSATGLAQTRLPLFFADEFANNFNGWAVWNNPGSGMWFWNGSYHMEIRKDYNQPVRFWGEAVTFDPGRDFAIETKITYRTGNKTYPDHSYWLQWGAKPDGRESFSFGIYPDGRFEYGRTADGRWTVLTERTVASAHIKTGDNSTNTLRVERKKDDLLLFINGVQVHKAKYEPFHSSNKAVAFQGCGRIELDIDYLRIYQEPAAPGNPYFGLKGLYPKFTALPQDAKTYANGYLYSGRVEGDCREGEGRYVTIQKVANQNGSGYHLQYWYFQGRFSENGRKFSGKRYSKWIPLTLEKNEFRFKDGAVNVADLEQEAYNGFTGEFIILPTNSGYKDLPAFVLQGKGERDLCAMEKFKWKSISGHYHNYSAAYLTIDYDGTRKFTGLVLDYQPVLGVMDYGNGDKYEGAWLNEKYFGPGRLTKNGQVLEGIWNGGEQPASVEKVFIPDAALLLKAAVNHAQNLPVDLKLNPFHFAGDWDNHFAGGIYNEAGEAVGMNFSGTGFIYGDNKNIYFGGFKNGQPDGTGFYRVQRGQDGAYQGGPNVYAGKFENGYFLAGHSRHKTKTDKGLADKQATTPIFPGVPELLPAARLIAAGKAKEGEEQFLSLAGSGHDEAAYWLGKLYQDGVALPKDINKAVLHYRASAERGFMPSLIALGLIYGNGTDGVAVDQNRAMELLKRGAAIPVSPDVSQASVDYCRGNYFVLKYPFLRFEQAVKYSLADEANPASELAKVIAAEQGKYLAAQKKQAEQQQAYAAAVEENRILNNKLGWIKGTHRQNLKTKWIYHVSPNRPLYEGNLVEISIQYHDTKQTDYFYERLEALLDENLYKQVGIKRCDTCQGKGYTSKSYNRTVADYEYTLGKKIVQTTTHNNACGVCGGCGLVPR
jgi:hypothetical protein